MPKPGATSIKKKQGLRDIKAKLNPKTMVVEDVRVLTCPLCNRDEVLKGPRIRQINKIKLTVDAGSTRQIEASDVCSACVQRVLDAAQPGADKSAEDI